MRNCIIVGTGRSGTSMVAGMVASAGYFIGHTPLPPSVNNPKGYFESREVERINDLLIESMMPSPEEPARLGKPENQVPQPNFEDLPEWARAHWLALIPPNRQGTVTQALEQEIRELVSNEPYCFKDPRFSYTLASWRPLLKTGTRFVCVFRHPHDTIKSLLHDVTSMDYLRGLRYSQPQARKLWILMYRHILERHSTHGDWLFIRYAHAFTKENQERLSDFLDVEIDGEFPDPSLRHFRSQDEPTGELLDIFQELKNRASC